MVPAAVKIAIRQNRRLARATLFVLVLFKPKNRCPFTPNSSNTDRRIRCFDNHLLSQTRKAFTSARPLIPVLFAHSVAKKPHIPLNTGKPLDPPVFLCGFPPLHKR